jgi:hypothetical protein
MEEIKIKSTSSSSAEADPIILRITDKIRLVFIPSIVENPTNSDACVRGVFVYQKKLKADEWESIKDIKLNTLKSSEGVQLEINSEEVLHLMNQLAVLKEIYNQNGVPVGEVSYVKTPNYLTELNGLPKEALRKLLDINNTMGTSLFIKLMDWLSNISDHEKFVECFNSINPETLTKINVIASLGSLRRLLSIWEINQDNDNEEFWQNEFVNNPYLLSQLFAYPVVLVKDKAYIGGKGYDNKGGSIIDFLGKSILTNNAVLVEIKTPVTQLTKNKYRNSIYNISEELTGAVIQVANYSYTISHNQPPSGTNQYDIVESFKPHSVVIVGNGANELDDIERRKSFELFRRGLKDVDIITFDELFVKINNLISILESE